MERIKVLVKEHGMRWRTLTEILHLEWFTQDAGTPLTVDTLRKRYKRWLEQSGVAPNKEEPHVQENDARRKVIDPETTT